MPFTSQQLIHSNQWRYRACRHGLFWLLYFLGYSFLDLNTYYGPFDGLQLAVRWMPFCVLNTYVTLWLVKQYLLQSKYRTFFLSLLGWTAALIPLSFLTHLYVAYPYCWPAGPRPTFRQALWEFFDIYPIFVNEVITGFAVFLRLYKFWRVELLQKLQLSREKTDAELELLKAQLHPHFLFNTINNLYALIQERSTRAPDMLLRLSAILGYVLNECQAPEVPLERELDFCQDYINLEAERYGDRLNIVTQFSGDLEDKMITPMLFQPFIENAFKHGAAEQIGKVWIKIRMSVHETRLLFEVTNTADASLHSSSSGGGIGVANIQRRLQLIYPDRHKFVRKQENGLHSISLTIDLLAPAQGQPYGIRKKSKLLRVQSARLQSVS
jgi:Histidine kinase